MAPVNVALVGATGLVGEAILALLEERDFPVRDLYLLASDESEGKRLEFRGQHHKVRVAADFDYDGVDLAFMAVPPAVALEQSARAVAAGCRVVDLSAASRDNADVPLLVAGVNDAVVAADTMQVASPSADVIFLSRVLSILAGCGDINQVFAAVQVSASSFGRGPVQELASQSIALFNMKEAETSSLGCRMAFNVVDLDEAIIASENRREFVATTDQLARINPSWGRQIAMQHNLVPVFHGMMLNLSIIYSENPRLDGLEELIKQSDHLQLAGDKDKLHDLSVLTYGSGTDFVYIGTIKPLTGSTPGLQLTIVGDNVRAGVARNAVEAGERLLTIPS